MHFFYTPEINERGFILNEGESHHALKVLRLKAGSTISMTDGKGKLFTGIIEGISGKKPAIGRINLIEEISGDPFSLHLAVAPPKSNDRLQFLVEKAVEIGIQKITFINCHHSERKNIRIDKIHNFVIAAVKQSMKLYVPSICDMTSFDSFIAEHNEGYIAHCNENYERTSIADMFNEIKDHPVLIGPEGDFSDDEIEKATKAGYTGLSLSSSRLRTETAAITVCAIANQHIK